MTKEEFIQFEKLVRTNHVVYIDTDYEPIEILRAELFENGEHGTWVNVWGKSSFQSSCSLKGFKTTNYRVHQLIDLDLTPKKEEN